MKTAFMIAFEKAAQTDANAAKMLDDAKKLHRRNIEEERARKAMEEKRKAEEKAIADKKLAEEIKKRNLYGYRVSPYQYSLETGIIWARDMDDAHDKLSQTYDVKHSFRDSIFPIDPTVELYRIAKYYE